MAMDEKRLAGIEARRECWECGDHHAGARLLTEDLPALVAEVRRLQMRERDLETNIRERDTRIVGMRKAMNETVDREDFNR